METPRRYKFSKSLKIESKVPGTSSDTKPADNDYSPIYFPSTQEANEDIDVLWDWNSPQTSQRKRLKQKRVLPLQSPNFPLKRQPSNTQSQDFEKLKNELIALKEELAIPDDESCLCVSPQQEMEFKGEEGNNLVEAEPVEVFDDDLFDDSIDEHLVLFSQKVEKQIKEKEEAKHNMSLCDNIEDLINKYTKKEEAPVATTFGNDSFDAVFGTFCMDESMVNFQKNHKVPLPRTMSDTSFNNNQLVKQDFLQRTKSFDLDESILPQSTIDEIEKKRLEALAKLKSKKGQSNITNKVEFHRTKSFEIASSIHDYNLPKDKLDEIERKRLEARARLEAKKRQETVIVISPDEIEKKRLEALAKREAKRLQEIVEKNRQEALKKLRMKNALNVKSTLIKRL